MAYPTFYLRENDSIDSEQKLSSLTLSVGYHKPDTEIFRLAYEGYNTTDYRDILHVGDSYTNDYDAAMRVGVNARLITDKAHPDCPHTHTISSINHLVL